MLSKNINNFFSGLALISWQPDPDQLLGKILKLAFSLGSLDTDTVD